jgi:integrase
MSLYRPKRSPFWHYDFRLDGYRFSGSTKQRNEDDAARAEETAKADAQRIVDRIRAAGAEPLTLKAACDRWHSTHGARLADGKNKAVLDRLVARMVEERAKDVRRDSTDDKGRQLYRPITPTTVNRTLDALRRVVRRARDNWNAALVREPVWKKHRLKETKRPVREISAAEETALDALEDLDFAELRRFAIITGLRRSNLLLTWPQVDFELGVVRVITKGGVPRVLPLSAEAYEILWKRRGQHPQSVFTFKAGRTRRCPHHGTLQIRGERYPITYYGLGSRKRVTWKAAGVDARLHDLRHTTGMRTLRKTGNLRVVQKILGHTDIAITAKFYTDATLEDMRAAMDATAPRQVEPSKPKAIEQKGD